MIRTCYSLFTRLKTNQIECGEGKYIKNNWMVQRYKFMCEVSATVGFEIEFSRKQAINLDWKIKYA